MLFCFFGVVGCHLFVGCLFFFFWWSFWKDGAFDGDLVGLLSLFWLFFCWCLGLLLWVCLGLLFRPSDFFLGGGIYVYKLGWLLAVLSCLAWAASWFSVQWFLVKQAEAFALRWLGSFWRVAMRFERWLLGWPHVVGVVSRYKSLITERLGRILLGVLSWSWRFHFDFSVSCDCLWRHLCVFLRRRQLGHYQVVMVV